jgi:hypothetical protein
MISIVSGDELDEDCISEALESCSLPARFSTALLSTENAGAAMMRYPLRVQERDSVLSDKKRGLLDSWQRLLGLLTIGLGLLGIVINQIDIAPVPYGLSLAVAGAGILFLREHGSRVGRRARPTISEGSVVWFSSLNLAITNAILYLSFHVEKRPTFVFFLMAAQAGLIAVQVLFSPCSSPRTRLFLRSQVILLSLGIVLSRLIVFPEIGVDVWPQKFFAQIIVDGGHFPPVDTAYKGYPFWPVLIAVIAMLTGHSAQQAVLITALTFSSVALWLLLVGLQSLFGYRESILTGLILSVSGWFVYWASLAVPMIVTVAIFNAILVLLFERQNKLRLPLTVCILILLVAGAFYHPMANVASSLMLITAASATWLLVRRGTDERQLLLSTQAHRAALFALFAIVLTLTVWMYMGDTFDSLALVFYRSIQQLEPLSFRGAYRSPLVYELDYLGFHLLLLLALARFLHWWVRPSRSSLEITLLGGSLVFLGINYFAVVTDAFFALPHRWLVYASVLLSFAVAVELWHIAYRGVLGMAFSFLFVMVLAFTAVTNTSINEDNPLYGADVAYKQSLSVAEVATLEFLDRHLVTRTAVDWQIWNYFRASEDLGLRSAGTLDQLLMYQEGDKGGVCPDLPSTLPEAALLRQVYLNRRVGWTTCTVEPLGIAPLDQARDFAKVYDGGDASFYQRVINNPASSGSPE